MASAPPCWGVLKLISYEMPDEDFPLMEGSARSVQLRGDGEMLVGRNAKAVVRLNKSQSWMSNKHFSIQHDSGSGRSSLKDLSSNGTWVNGERIVKEAEHALKPGDVIEIAADFDDTQRITEFQIQEGQLEERPMTATKKFSTTEIEELQFQLQ